MGWLTMDTLRPRWDASRERSVTCPRPGPRIERRGARVEKTQLGQGLFVATRVLGICYDVARLSQDVATEQTRVYKGTARPGSIWRADSGEAAVTRSGQPAMQMADRRVSKLRPSCLKSYAAGMGRRSEGMGHSNRRICRTSAIMGHLWEVENPRV